MSEVAVEPRPQAGAGAATEARALPRRPRLPEFIAGDPIRGIGALAVITYHAGIAALVFAGALEHHAAGAGFPASFARLGAGIGTLLETGAYALPLFFALSGYLISRPFIFAIARGQPLPRLSSYARNRFLRIVPAFWVVLTALLLIYGTKGASGRQIVSVYTFVQFANRTPLALLYGQTWSVRAEVFFYLLVPITAWLVLLATRRASGRARNAVVVALPVVLAVSFVDGLTWSTRQLGGPVTYLSLFLPGVAFAGLETFLPEHVERFARRHPRAGWTLPTLVVLVGFLLLFGVQRFEVHSLRLGASAIVLGISGLLGGALLLQWGTGGCWRLLDNRPLRWIGQRSYSIYLVHLAIVVELAPRLEHALGYNYKQTFLALDAAAIAASLLLGDLLFRAVEAPFMSLKTFGWRSPERAAFWRRAALWRPSQRWLDRGPSAAQPDATQAPALAPSPAAAEPARYQPAPRVRLPEFLAGDPIRGVGVICVVAYHVAFYSLYFAGALQQPGNFTPLGPNIGPLIETGGYALALFFGLSGYLIARPFVFAVVRGERFPRIWSYTRNRLLRIVPTFWFVFSLILLIFGTRGASTGHILSTYGFTEGWQHNPLSRIIGQAWSLRAEAFFYVVMPISAWLLYRGTRSLRLGVRLRTAVSALLPLAVAAGVVYFAVYALLHLSSSWIGERTSPIVVFYIFMPGISLAALETFLPGHVARFGGRHPRWAWAVPTLIAGASVVLLYCNQRFRPGSPELASWLIFVGISGLLGGALLLQWGTGGCWRLLDNRVFRWLGQRSYSTYLVHLAIVVELAPRIERALGDNYKQTFVALLAASLVASIVLGDLVFRLVEAPFMNLKTFGWRSSERAAVWRRAAFWIPSRRWAILERARTRLAASHAAGEPAAAETAVAEPSGSPAVPGGS